MARMRWVKLWTQETLYGTTNRELTLEERGIWFEMLALAGDSPTPGTICISPGVSFTPGQLAHILGANESLLQQAIVKLTSPEINKINFNGSGLIQIVNWSKYQSEFDRTEYQREYMKTYRKRKTNTRKTKSSESMQQNRGEGRGGEVPKEEIEDKTVPPLVPPKGGIASVRDILDNQDELLKLQTLYSISENDLKLEIEHCAAWWEAELNRRPAKKHKPLAALYSWLKKRKDFPQGGQRGKAKIPLSGNLGPWDTGDEAPTRDAPVPGLRETVQP